MESYNMNEAVGAALSAAAGFYNDIRNVKDATHDLGDIKRCPRPRKKYKLDTPAKAAVDAFFDVLHAAARTHEEVFRHRATALGYELWDSLRDEAKQVIDERNKFGELQECLSKYSNKG